MTNSELIAKLRVARSYIRDLASSLENACEDFDFDGEENEDPQAREEVKEARDFADSLDAIIDKAQP